MGISAIFGLPGRGKSLFSTYFGLTLSEKYKRKLVTNFPLKLEPLADYCRYMGLKWVSENLSNDLIYYIRTDKNVAHIMAVKNSIILFDEAGVYLPARGATYNTPRELLDGLCQVRHDGQHLIYIAQSDKQVDIAIRNLTEDVFQCDGIIQFSQALGNDELVWKNVYRFNPDGYAVYLGDPKVRKNPLKCRILANKTWQGPLSCLDSFSFTIYDSFKRLSEQSISDEVSDLYYASCETKKVKAWKVKGVNPSKFHHFSKHISFLMCWFPYPFLRFVLKLDKKLANFQGFSSDGADIEIKNPGSWNSFDTTLKVVRLEDCADGDGDGINDDGSDPDGKEFRYFIWIDYFRGGEYVDIPDDYMEPINTNGILFGLFGGSPKGCQAVGVKVSLKGQGLAWYLYDDRVTLLGNTANLPDTELTYGYRLATKKPELGSSTISVDSSKFPVSFSNSAFYEYSAYAQWINPQCYWSPSSASSPGFFGGILDIFRGIFRR